MTRFEKKQETGGDEDYLEDINNTAVESPGLVR